MTSFGNVDCSIQPLISECHLSSFYLIEFLEHLFRLMLRKKTVFMVEHVPAERTQRQHLVQRQKLPSGSLPTVPRAAHVALYWKPREGGRKILVPHEQYERLIKCLN